jgi:hypothetical protein
MVCWDQQCLCNTCAIQKQTLRSDYFKYKEEAAYYLNDLEQMIGDKDVLFYPGSYRRPYQIEDTDNANVLLRAECSTESIPQETGYNCYLS